MLGYHDFQPSIKIRDKNANRWAEVNSTWFRLACVQLGPAEETFCGGVRGAEPWHPEPEVYFDCVYDENHPSTTTTSSIFCSTGSALAARFRRGRGKARQGKVPLFSLGYREWKHPCADPAANLFSLRSSLSPFHLHSAELCHWFLRRPPFGHPRLAQLDE
jgi:hypothetical protein